MIYSEYLKNSNLMVQHQQQLPLSTALQLYMAWMSFREDGFVEYSAHSMAIFPLFHLTCLGFQQSSSSSIPLHGFREWKCSEVLCIYALSTYLIGFSMLLHFCLRIPPLSHPFFLRFRPHTLNNKATIIYYSYSYQLLPSSPLLSRPPHKNYTAQLYTGGGVASLVCQ